MPVRLSATTLAPLNGCGGPSRRALNLMEDILSTCYKCIRSAITNKSLRLYVDTDISFCFGMRNSCPKFVSTIQLHPVFGILFYASIKLVGILLRNSWKKTLWKVFNFNNMEDSGRLSMLISRHCGWQSNAAV
jgi:hypothetical protein